VLVSSPEVLLSTIMRNLDFVLNFEIVLVDEIVSFNLVGRDDDFFRGSPFLARNAETMY